MNPFQRAREEAVKLRAKLLGERAGEAVHVCEFLTPEPVEAKLRLGIEYVAKGSQELGDAEAILRRSEDYIYVRRDFPDPERAYLVAHELGHFVLDDVYDEVTIASLKALSGAEGSPGVIKVEAYGARERQELRANVFARELQLPRAVARKLFDAGVGPRQVADDYGIHLEIARQQMLDAALLPDLNVEPSTKPQHPPSEDQLRAAQAAERFANVVAGPGSGKTSTLVHRVRDLIERQGVDPSQILVLTFTNKAAFELVDRLRDAGIARAADVWAGTFHAFGLEFLRKYYQRFELESDIVVADKLNAITLLNADLPNVELNFYKRIEDPYAWLPEVVSGIKRLKEQMVTPEEYRAAVEELPADDYLKLRRADVATLYERHEHVLKNKKLVDFVDLVAKPARALEEDRPRFGELADKFQYVLVDEYQDVTFAMVQLIKQLAKNAKSLWVVGDVRQAIHHWRGASVESLRRFAQTFKEQAGKTRIREYPLELNRRSSPEVLDLVKHIGREHVLEADLPLADTQATAKSGPLPTVFRCTPSASMPDGVAATVKRLHDEGFKYGQQAVLSRWNHEVANLATALRVAEVPVLYIGELAQRSDVKRLLCLMQLLVERQPRALVGLMSIPDLAVDIAELEVLMQHCADHPELQRGGWLWDFPAGLSSKTQGAAGRIATLLQGQQRRSNPWSFVCDLLLERRFGFPEKTDQSIEAHASRIALWQFAYATRAGDGERKIPTLPRFLLRQQLRQRIGETYSERELPAEAATLDAVHMLTVHGSKGLEFDAVHVSNVNKDDYGPEWANWKQRPDILQIVPPEVLGSDQDGWDDEAAVERNNLLYVAVSRAKQYLALYEDGEDPGKRAPQLAQVSALCSRDTFVSAVAGAAGGAALPPSTTPTDPMDFSEFETYARCPLQHWYRYELELPGEQQVDISARARWAIAAALRAVAADQALPVRDVFVAAWEAEKLPGKAEDKQLWDHAVAVFKDGVRVIKEVGGVYAEPVTVVDGYPIQLPWVLLSGSAGARPAVDVIKVHVGDLKRSVAFWRPMLNGMRPRGGDSVTMHNLLDGISHRDGPSGRLSSTNPYKAVQKLRAGDHSSMAGKHCAWCACATLCPTRPEQ